MNHYIQTALKYIGGNAAANAIGLLCTILLTRNLELSQFGLLALIQATVALIETLTNLQCWQGLVKLGHDHAKDRSALPTLLRVGVISDVTGSFASMLISGAICFLLYSDVVGVIPLFAYLISCSFRFSGVTTGLLRLKENFAALYQRAGIVSAVRLAGLGALLAVESLSLEFILLLYGISECIGTFFHLTMSGICGHRKFSLLRNSELEEKFFRYNSTLWIGSLFSNTVKQVDVLLLGALLTSADAGIYRVLKQVGSIGSLLTQPIAVMLFPELSKRVAREGEDNVMRKVRRMGGQAAMLALAAYLLSLPLLGLILKIFGEGLAATRGALSVYLLGVFLTLGFSYLHPLLMAVGRVQSLMRFNIINSLFYFVYAWAFICNWGVMGAAMAYVTYVLLSILPRWISAQRKEGRDQHGSSVLQLW